MHIYICMYSESSCLFWQVTVTSCNKQGIQIKQKAIWYLRCVQSIAIFKAINTDLLFRK